MHVDPGNGVADRADDVRVVVARERRMDPALEADLGRAALPRLLGTPDDLVAAGRGTARRADSRASFPFENAQKPQRK